MGSRPRCRDQSGARCDRVARARSGNAVASQPLGDRIELVVASTILRLQEERHVRPQRLSIRLAVGVFQKAGRAQPACVDGASDFGDRRHAYALKRILEQVARRLHVFAESRPIHGRWRIEAVGRGDQPHSEVPDVDIERAGIPDNGRLLDDRPA